MKTRTSFPITFFVALLTTTIVTGCATSEMTTKRNLAEWAISKPGRIIVYNFASSVNQIDEGSVITPYVQQRTTPQTLEQKAMGLKLGDLVAGHLVKDILALGMPAERENSCAEINSEPWDSLKRDETG